PTSRLAKRRFDLATTAARGKDVRGTRIGARLAAERRRAWEQWYGPVAAARTVSAIWHTAAWLTFGAAYVAAVVFVTAVLAAPAGSVILVLAAGSRLSAYVAGAVGEIGFLRGSWLDDPAAVAAAVEHAGAGDVVAQLASGIETQLGATWPEGVEISFGQWQKLALARGFMREQPLLLVLDEPTAALDAETEHALFQ